MGSRFSIASVVLSYFMVAGGMFTGLLVAGYIKVDSMGALYGLLGLGAFVGGFIAARASRGSTVVEPGLGGLLVVITIVWLVAGTSMGKYLWANEHGETVKVIALTAASGAIGAIAGAVVSERFFGEATTSAMPWIIYTAFASFGACVLVAYIATVLALGGKSEEALDTLVKMMFVGLAAGCVISGIAVGASARVRPLGAAFLGGAAGPAGLGLLGAQHSTSKGDAAAGIAVLAVGGAILTLIGALIGWAAVGKKQAAAS